MSTTVSVVSSVYVFSVGLEFGDYRVRSLLSFYHLRKICSQRLVLFVLYNACCQKSKYDYRFYIAAIFFFFNNDCRLYYTVIIKRIIYRPFDRICRQSSSLWSYVYAPCTRSNTLLLRKIARSPILRGQN